jgi:hypothetical protein
MDVVPYKVFVSGTSFVKDRKPVYLTSTSIVLLGATGDDAPDIFTVMSDLSKPDTSDLSIAA